MHFRYGSYRHPDGEVGLRAYDRVLQKNTRGNPSIEVMTMVLELEVVADGQAAIDKRIREIDVAYSRQGYDAGFYLDQGGRSQNFMVSATSLGGVQVVQPPSWSDRDGAEYATHRSGSIVLQATYFAANAEQTSHWQESLRFIGDCGPRYSLVETDTGTPERYLVQRKTKQIIIQSGRHITLTRPPGTPQMLYSRQMLIPEQSQVSWHSPNVLGGKGIEYGVDWTFTFESERPRNGLPRAR